MDPLQIESALAALDARLSRIEAILSVAPVRAPAPVPPPQAPAPPPRAPAPDFELPAAARPGNWLGLIAVICFVMAAGFIVKLSIDSGWLTPTRQIGLAALLGLALVGAGLALRRTDRSYAALLPAAGVVVLYLTAFAAHRYYGLISFTSAVAVTSAVSGLCVWLYTEMRHDLYAFTAAAGAYLAPVVLDFHAGADFSLYYFLLCSMAFAVLSSWLHSRALTIVSSHLAILISGAIGLGLGRDAMVAEILALQFVIFAAGSWFYTAHNRATLTRGEAQAFLPVLLVFYALEYCFLGRIAPGAVAWIALGFAAVLIGLYLAVKTFFADSRHSQWLILALATLVIFHAGYLQLMPDTLRPWLFSAILLGAAFLPGRTDIRDNPLLVPALGLLAVMAIEYVILLGGLWTLRHTPGIAAYAAIVSLWLAIGVSGRLAMFRQILLVAAHLLALLAFYRLGVEVSSLAVSALWLLYGAGVLVFAVLRRDDFMARSALVVLGFAAGKALLIDAASAPTILRILCLLLTGVVLYGCGFLMRRFSAWNAAGKA